MNITNEENMKEDPVKWFGMTIAYLPTLLIKSGGSFLRFKLQAKKAGKVFRKELINQGIDKKMAEELTEEYVKGSELFKTLMQLRQTQSMDESIIR